MQNSVYTNYFGSKNGSGVAQQIINQIRPHDVYMELFAGSGAIAQAKKAAPVRTYINDVDPAVSSRWTTSTVDIPNCAISGQDAVMFLKTFKFSPDLRYCIYLDPPYPLSSRRSNRDVYRFEMQDAQHVDMLNTVLCISGQSENVDFLISTYENQIYKEMLHGWELHTFAAQTRVGTATELLYMNYSNDAGILHQYDFLGEDRTDRQRVKRRIDREISKLKRLPARERNAILSAVLDLVQT